ncbi:MAG: hypothetical protein RI894_306 [Bacteroidota bacterium]|jgi:hypothetical protein
MAKQKMTKIAKFYLIRGINHTLKEIYHGVSDTNKGTFYQKEVLSLKLWYHTHKIDWTVLATYDTKIAANKDVKEQEETFAKKGFVNQTDKKIRAKIIATINKHVEAKYTATEAVTNYPKWKVGITNNVETRKKTMIKNFEVKRLANFKPFDARTNDNAKAIEKHFCDIGMERCKNQVFDVPTSQYVYTFTLPAPIAKENMDKAKKRLDKNKV